tara:strand:- start:328 stop:1056 length:729 start_codon:yes stop_codon:yes gene_type:complete
MDKIIIAFQFLTILPLKVKSFRQELLAESTIYFPLVGLTLGIGLAGLEYCLSPFLPIDITAIIQVAFLALVTRGLHIDGFADTFDGLGCVKSPKEKLKVMKDSRIGAMGAISVIFLILLKYNSIAFIDQSLKIYALIVFPMASRWTMVLAIFFSSQMKHSGLGSKFQKEMKEKYFMLSTILPCLISIYLFDIIGLTALIGIAIITTIFYQLLLKSFGKITGDHFGFINEAIEVVTLMIFLMF